MAKLSSTKYPGDWEYHPGEEFTVKLARDEEQLKQIIDNQPKSDAVSLVGALLAFPEGDGYAYYVVVKDKPLTVAWVPYLDEWQADECTIRGVTEAYVRQALKRKEFWKKGG